MKKTTMLLLGVLPFLYLFSFFLISATSEDITAHLVYVGGSGEGNFTQIQDALDMVTPGGTAYVFPGTYHENLRITTPVHLIGDDKNTTIIDGRNKEFVVILEAGNSTLSGFMITNSELKFPFAGVYVASNHNTISNNVITDNYYGMQLGYSASYNLVVNNSIYHNRQCGIYFNHASHNRLIGNTVFDHQVNGFGLYEFSNNNSILENTFSENRDTGINIRESYDNLVANNRFIQGHIALHKPAPEYHSLTQDNLFSDNVVSVEEERDAFVLTVVIFDVLVLFVFFAFRKFVN
jgi:parallel beta-helix repeat protein